MSIKKPSEAEDEYFQRAELERIQRARAKLDAARAEQRQAQQAAIHWMRCPKCGTEMKETLLRHVVVDACGNCGYIGFDCGELEMLLGNREPVLAKLAEEVRRMFTIGRAPRDPVLQEVLKAHERDD